MSDVYLSKGIWFEIPKVLSVSLFCILHPKAPVAPFLSPPSQLRMPVDTPEVCSHVARVHTRLVPHLPKFPSFLVCVSLSVTGTRSLCDPSSHIALVSYSE